MSERARRAEVTGSLGAAGLQRLLWVLGGAPSADETSSTPWPGLPAAPCFRSLQRQ